MKILGFLALAVVVASSVQVRADSVKHVPEAARGCIPALSLPKANAAIERYNLDQSNATKDELRALGTALHWIERLNGGEPLHGAVADSNTGYTFKFRSGKGFSEQTKSEIIIRRNGEQQLGKNVAQLVHELGHFLGNNGAYEEYREAMKGSYCVVSGYSDDKFNEQFAEAFAAFVTFPKLMKAVDSTGCRKAYDYFSRKLFSNGHLAEKCADGTLRAGVDY